MSVPRSPRLLVLLPLAAVLVAACTGGAGTTPGPSATPAPSSSGPASSGDPSAGPITDPSVLVGRRFLSTGISGRDLVQGSQVRLVFRADTLGASAGCNSMGGAWQVADSTLHVGQLATTEMACAKPLMDQDTWLAGFLDGAAMTFDGTTLTLAGDGVTLTLMDEKVANPDKPLEGTRWVVEGLVRDQAVSSVPQGLVATLVFANGRVAVDTSCNKGNATTTVGEGTITFGPMALTRMACGEASMDLETFIAGVLQGEVASTIDADQLHLLGAGGGLDLRAQQP
jgi:heat shock protein HslJ